MRRLFVLTHLARRRGACQRVPIWMAALQSRLTLESESERERESARQAFEDFFFFFRLLKMFEGVKRLPAFLLANRNVFVLVFFLKN